MSLFLQEKALLEPLPLILSVVLRSPPNPKHCVFYKGVEIIGTVFTTRLDDNKVALRLLAIDSDLKIQGYSSILLKKFEAIIKNEEYKTILLHANRLAYSFYKRNGYNEMEFTEENIIDCSCIDMGKTL